MKHLLLAGIIAGAWSSSALAADLGPYTPPPPPREEPIYAPAHGGPWNWQGLYFGGNGGYAWGGETDAEGWFGGGQIGYNAQFRSLVLGVEADLQGADISDTVSFGAFGDATTDINWFSTVRGRIGYAAGPTLFYLTGGWAFADVDYSLNTGPSSASSDGIKDGYTLGGGVEWQFAPNWSLKTEYLYVDLGEETLSTPAGTYTTETDFHTARVGVNFRF